MERITFGLTGAPAELQLEEFVMQLERLLKSLVFHEKYSNLFYPDMLPQMRDAWLEVEPRFLEYTVMVSKVKPEVLKLHGLTGHQLRFKFDAINFIASRFFKHFFNGNNISITRKWLKKLLEIIDKLFRSLLTAVPGGGAIEEFKDITESLIPDADEEDV